VHKHLHLRAEVQVRTCVIAAQDAVNNQVSTPFYLWYMAAGAGLNATDKTVLYATVAKGCSVVH
jgi:hypothetical protein